LNFYYYAQQQASSGVASAQTDDLASVSSPLRTELLERACELFLYATGYHPKAFRAGNWRANRALMSDLVKVGIRLDSSFNPASRAGGSFAGEVMAVNALQRLDGLWELPLSAVRQRLPEPHLVNGVRPFDLVSLSAWEIRKALDDTH